ncbi:MAG: transcriptional regulator, partial [Actinomycetota bacterium]
MRARLRTALAEPAVADPPRRVRRDRVLLVAILLAAVLEVTFREDVPNRWVSFAFTLLASTTVLFRRTRPLAAIVVAFGFVTIGDVVMGLVGREQIELYSMAFFLLLPYALTRWASGRDALLGLLVVDLAWLADIVFQYPGLGDAVGGAVFLMFPA